MIGSIGSISPKEEALVDDLPSGSFWFFLGCGSEEAGHCFL